MAKLTERQWMEKYKSAIQNEELISLIKFDPIAKVGPWAFLKLAFLWNLAHTYTNIIGRRYSNMCYVDLFSGSGLGYFKDYSENKQFLLGSSTLMATMPFKYPFKKCFFFEKNQKLAKALERRLCILKKNKKLTCNDYSVLPYDCNAEIDRVISEMRGTSNVHFLLFVDPYSTEIYWSTMEKLLALSYPHFDMVFNFQPFGVNRKSCKPETLINYFGDEGYKEYLGRSDVLSMLEGYYIQKLKEHESVNTARVIRIESGKGAFFYDLVYTTRKDKPPWLPAVEHIKKMIEKITGYEVSVIFDPTIPPLSKF